MQPGYICVAGIEPATGKHIRPVLNRRLQSNLLRKNGGVFEIGALVELGPTRHVGRAPELEDHEFSVENLQYIQPINATNFWDFATQTSAVRLSSILGDELRERDTSCTVDVDSGAGLSACAIRPDSDQIANAPSSLEFTRAITSLFRTSVRAYKPDCPAASVDSVSYVKSASPCCQ